ncbi:hypothetical protein [Salinactinospora qingdaonensis]|uniref:WD40 repeat domain-containing protein n=1 Tax=Salinactinospora qingdaonensis TaxID=702744 RepID=A0ABP7G8R7_9ACTN
MTSSTGLPLLAAALLAVTVPAMAGPAVAAPSEEESPEERSPAFHISDPRVVESSGLAASRHHEGVYWTHNDSGEQYAPMLYGVDDTGETVATVTLTGAGVQMRDWEAVAVAPGADGEPAIYVGDIGDNFDGGWPTIRLYRLPEPRTLGDTTVEATTFTFSYADGGRDAESLLVDPRDGRIYIVSKEAGGGIYAAPEELATDATNQLTRLGSAPLYATDASFAPDGSHYAIRTYWGATIYDATDGVPGSAVERLTLPDSAQGESLAYTGTGDALLAGSEGATSPVWRIPVPGESGEDTDDAATGASPSPAATSAGGDAAGGRDLNRVAGTALLIGVGAVALAIAGIVWLARRS